MMEQVKRYLNWRMLYNHTVLGEGLGTYSAVQVNVDVVAGDVKRELLVAFHADFTVVLVKMEELVAHCELWFKYFTSGVTCELLVEVLKRWALVDDALKDGLIEFEVTFVACDILMKMNVKRKLIETAILHRTVVMQTARNQRRRKTQKIFWQ